MIIFDQLRRNDPHLPALTLVVLTGLSVLFVGLWYVQVVLGRYFQSNLETQSYRTVRIPAVRGKILDRNGVPLAENRPSYNVSLYLEELSKQFRVEYTNLRPVQTVTNFLPFWKRWFGFSPVKKQRVKLNSDQDKALQLSARYRVTSRVVAELGNRLLLPLTLDEKKFHLHYKTRLALPMTVATNLNATNIARLQEQSGGLPALDLEIQPVRIYPHQTLAAHLLGHLQRDDSSASNEAAFFTYRLPDWRGIVGVEAGFDQQLRGKAGEKSVLVNHLGYRQSQNIWSAVEPGQNVVLTIDFSIQQAAEQALRRPFGSATRGAAVVMDVRNGDILALASSPTYNPNLYIKGISRTDNEHLNDPLLRPEINRATQMQYQAGSTFKVIVALAALENRLNPLNPEEKYYVEPNPKKPTQGIIYVGDQPYHDTAPPGDYDLRRALVRSSNAYFINIGLRRGVFDRVVELGRRLHLGEKIGLRLRQEAAGNFPSAERVLKWPSGYRAIVCIGQGEMDVTPMQMAVLTSALANGGEVLQPRLVDRLESQDPTNLKPITVFPKHQVRDTLGVSQRSLNIVRDDMLAETEDAVEGTGRFARVAGLRICGKTGTAERKEDGQTRNTTWFISFAPYEHPKYAVVVAVEDGSSGGATCAPIAQQIYLAIQQRERMSGPKTTALTQAK